MKKKVWLRTISLLLVILCVFNSFDPAIAAAVDNLSNLPEKGEYYGDDINKDAETEKVKEVKQGDDKSEKVIRKPKIVKEEKEESYSKDKEILSNRTSNSKTYKLDEKTKVKEIYFDKIHYKDENGNLQEVDNTLNLEEEGKYYENQANDYSVNLPIKDVKDKGINVQKGQASITLFPIEGDFSRSAASENAILYNDVFEGIDYQYTVNGDSIKEDIILNHYVDKFTYTYKIDTKGVKLKEELNSIRGYEAGKEKPTFIISAPVIIDAAGKINENLKIKLEKNILGKDVITVTVDEKWMKSSERAYPVKIDPEVKLPPDEPIDVACVEENSPDVNTLNNGFAYIGMDDGVASGNNSFTPNGHQKTRTFVKFNHNVPKEATVTSAKLKLYKSTTFGNNTNREVGLYSVDKSYDITRLTWNNQPMSKTFYSSKTINGEVGYVDWDISGVVNDWVNGKTNNGVVLQYINETQQCESFITDYSKLDPDTTEHKPDPSKIPKIEIVYEYIDGVDTNMPFAEPSVNVRPIVEHDSEGSLKVDGALVDGLVKPDSTVNYQLDVENSDYKGNVQSSYTYKYPNGTVYSSLFPKAYVYKGKDSNWQADKIVTPKLNQLYRVKATATFDGETSSPGYSDYFQIYQVQSKDTIPYIASFYGVPNSVIMSDNKVGDTLLIEGNTLFIRNPKKNAGKPYTPPSLTDARKKEIDSALMGRKKHCVYGFEPINLITGNFYYEADDTVASDYNENFVIKRTYNAKQDIHDGYFGVKWDFNYNKSLSALSDGTIVYNQGDGSTIYYRKGSDGSYTGPVGEKLKFSKVNDETRKNIGYQITDGVITYFFNKMGLLDSEVDEKGNATILNYNKDYKLTSITSPAGKVFGIHLNDEGRIHKITLPNGSNLNYRYDEKGNLVSYIDANGNEIKYQYDEKGRMVSFIDGNSNKVIHNTYDNEDRVVVQEDAKGKKIYISYYDGYNETTDANGNKTKYYFDSSYRIVKTIRPDGKTEGKTYDENNNVKTSTDALGHTTTYEYDSRGNVIKEIRFDGKSKIFTYDSKDNPTSVTDFQGNTTTMSYDSMGNLLKVVRADKSTFEYSYNSKNQITTVKDPLGKIMKYAYNGADVSQITDAMGSVYKYFYNPMGKIVSIEDPLGKVTRIAYDAKGNESSIILPDGSTSTFGYDKNDNKNSVIDGNKNVSKLEYDSLNRVVKSIDPYGNVTSYAYDGNGNIIEEANPKGYKTQYKYDSLNRVVKVIDQDGGETTYGRDSLGNITSITDSKGNKSAYVYNYKVNQVEKVIGANNQTLLNKYDEEGNIVELTLPDGNAKKYKYDNLYRLIQMTDINGIVTNTNYDALDRITYMKDSLNREYFYNYDANGNLISTKDPLGYEVKYTYDKRNSLTALTDEEGKTTKYNYTDTGNLKNVTDALGYIQSYEYDKNGNLVAEVSPKGDKTIYNYDGLNRLISVQDSMKNITQYAYDKAGNMQKSIDPLGKETKYEYNGKNLSTKVTDALGQIIQMKYDKNGNITDIIYPNGDTVYMSYDNSNRMTAMKDTAGVEKTYSYDSMDKITQEEDSIGNKLTNTYDNQGRLIQQKDVLGRIIKYNYDLSGNIISKIDIDGNKTTYEYDKRDRVVKVIDPEGKVTTLAYDGLNRVIEKIEPGNKKYQYQYDDAGNLIKEIDPLKYSTSYSYDKNKNLTQVTDAKGNSKKYEYNPLDKLVSFIDEKGNKTNLNYDARSSLIKVQDPMGNITQYKYDAINRLEMEVDPLGFDTKYQYDSMNNLIAEIDAKGNKTSYEYNKHGLITKRIDPLNGVTQYNYDLNDRLTAQINPMGEKTSYGYDLVHRITSITDPEGYSKKLSYDEQGNLWKVSDSEGSNSIYTYDKMHRLLTEKNPAGHITSYGYGETGNLSSIRQPNGNTSFYQYDALDRINKTTDPEGNVTKIEYDSLGNIQKVVEQEENREYKYTYDAANNLESETNPLGEKTVYTYNKNNLLESITNPMGNKTVYKYNAVNLVSEVKNPEGTVTKYKYDKNQNLSSVIDGNNNKITYDYDKLNRLEKVTNSLGHETNYTYDKSSNLISMKDGNGNATNYTYDKVGRLTSVTNALGEKETFAYNPIGTLASYTKPDGAAISYDYDILNRLVSKEYKDQEGKKVEEKDVTYKYDISGNPIKMEGEEGETKYEYDKVGRLKKVELPTEENVKYEYDKLGRKTKVIYPDGKFVKYQYDKLDRMTSAENWNGEKTYYHYDSAGRVIDKLLSNGTKAIYTYDKDDRVVKLENKSKEGRIISSFEYQYDGAGNIIKEKAIHEDEVYIRTYSYDGASEIIAFSEEHQEGDKVETKKYNYSYDKAGNRISVEVKEDDENAKLTTYTYNSGDELIKEKSGDTIIKYEYDKNGNRVKKIRPGNKVEYYEYDLEDRLLQLTNPKGEVQTFGYDSDGNRLFSTYGVYFKPQEDKAENNNGNDNKEKENNKGNNKSKNKNKNNGNKQNQNPPKNDIRDVTNDILNNSNNTTPVVKTENSSNNAIEDKSKNQDKKDSKTEVAKEENGKDKVNNSNGNVQVDNKEEASKKDTNKEDKSKKSLIAKIVDSIKEAFKKVITFVKKVIKDIIKSIGDFFDWLFHGEAKEGNYFSVFGKKDKKDKEDKKDKKDKENKEDKKGDNGNHSGWYKDKHNNGNHSGWYKRSDHPKNPGGQEPLEDIENYQIINYVNDLSVENAQVLMTSDMNGEYTNAYTYGLDRISVDNLKVDNNIKTDPLYYLYDGRGSVADVINTKGQAKDKYNYEPYGVTHHGGHWGSSATHYENFYGYNGEDYNRLSGLQYLRARYYEPETGRFLTRDSYLGDIMEPLTLNRYAYGVNNPIMNIDPSGHWPKWVSKLGNKISSAASSLWEGTKKFASKAISAVKNTVSSVKKNVSNWIASKSNNNSSASRYSTRGENRAVSTKAYTNNTRNRRQQLSTPRITTRDYSNEIVRNNIASIKKSCEGSEYVSSQQYKYEEKVTQGMFYKVSEFIFPGVFDRYENRNNSLYDAINYWTFGFADTVNGAINPEKPLSLQHWIDSVMVVTTLIPAMKFASNKIGVQSSKSVISKGAAGAEIKALKPGNLKFKADEANVHFERHGKEMMDALSKSEYGIKNYINDANYVVKNGQYVPELNGFIQPLCGTGSAKYAFVGLDRVTGNITTLHIKTVSELSKKAPSLGFIKK